MRVPLTATPSSFLKCININRPLHHYHSGVLFQLSAPSLSVRYITNPGGLLTSNCPFHRHYSQMLPPSVPFIIIFFLYGQSFSRPPAVCTLSSLFRCVTTNHPLHHHTGVFTVHSIIITEVCYHQPSTPSSSLKCVTTCCPLHHHNSSVLLLIVHHSQSDVLQ